MADWPAWYPGLELRAAHLLGLEDFLLARSSLDRFSHGVDDLDPRTDVERSPDPGGIRVRLLGVRGLTPSGRPVVVPRGATLEVPVAAEPSTTYVVDLWVEVNAGDARDGKLTLRAASVLTQAPPFDVAGHPDALYLGRIRFHQLDAPTLVARPPVRTLAACRPHDPAWHEWVKPVASALRTAAAYAERRTGDRAALVPLQVEAAALQYRWPTMPVHELAVRLGFLRWLKDRAAAPAGAAAAEPILSQPPFPPPAATGDQLPRLLAAILEPGGGASVSDVLTAVLDRIYLRVPLDEFRQWRRWVAQPDAVADLDALAAAIAGRPERERFERWTRAAGLLTIHAFEQARLVEWPRGVVARYLEESRASDPAAGIAATLDRLMLDEGAQWPAGPLGFFEIATAASRFPDVVAASSPQVRAYFGELTRRGGEGGSPASGRVLAFLKRRQQDAGEAIGRIDGLLVGGGHVRRLPTDIDLRIVVLGTERSGKTSLVRAMRRASTDPSAPALAARVTFAAHPQLDLELDTRGGRRSIERYEARLDAAPDRVGRLSITEVPFEAVVSGDPSVAAALESAGMIAVMFDAPSLDRPSAPVAWFTAVARTLEPALRGRPHVQVAIAFTKADEYGTVDPRAMRVLSRAEEAMLLEKLRDASPSGVETAWRLFAEGVSVPARFGDAGETRRRLLEQTRELWTAVIRDCQHLAVNGYFLVTDPIDSYYQPWARRGVLQLMADALAAAGVAAERV